MEEIKVNAYAKINLCLDVLGKLPGGYHRVHMVMQQVDLHDEVTVRWIPDPSLGEVKIHIRSDSPALADDQTNLAYRAADLMARKYGQGRSGIIDIQIRKNIPMAAGLAGGSSDCGAVIHAVSCLWEKDLPLKELMEAGAMLGSDVPFCIMGQAAADPVLKAIFAGDPMAAHCAVASGRGTDLEPVSGLRSYLVITKPPISVSTAEVYRGMDELSIPERPDIDEMVRALRDRNRSGVEKNMVNVLENFTLKSYPIVVYTKNKIQDEYNSKPLMSGSGPTVFCLCESEEEAREICRSMSTVNSESYWTKTTS